MSGLILTRRPGESIKIGSSVTVTVLGIKGNQVRVNITAPSEISVDRAEVRESKERGSLVLGRTFNSGEAK